MVCIKLIEDRSSFLTGLFSTLLLSFLKRLENTYWPLKWTKIATANQLQRLNKRKLNSLKAMTRVELLAKMLEHMIAMGETAKQMKEDLG